MTFESAGFVFQPPPRVAFARRILVKPRAGFPRPHPYTTSRETLAAVITGIRRISDADILILDGSQTGEPMESVYKQLGYDFPRAVMVDVNKCDLLEVENPLPKPFALSTFWVPSVVLSCDFLISVAPFQVVGGSGNFSIMNLLGLLPASKYVAKTEDFPWLWQRLGIHNVCADLYFTLPFDMGVVDGRKRLISEGEATEGTVQDYGKIFVGSPYDADCEAAKTAGVDVEYLHLIERVRTEQPSWFENANWNCA